ncbi:MAG TPA: DUF2087 domain-containing protein [Actinomycetota bacterium]|nr:DUF2087 domain-containing protein [Actinomycetota bacterium]
MTNRRGPSEEPPSQADATPEELLGVLADPERLAVAGALAGRPATAVELASSLNLRPDRVRRHLSKLTKAGLVAVDRDRRTYRYQPEALREAARSMSPSREAGLALGAVYEEEEQVLRRYFQGGRLREIPAKHSKRLIILSRLALEFDVGVRYSEQQINQRLKEFHKDYAALRRYLVDEGFLSRERGQYWRSGGPVNV